MVGTVTIPGNTIFAGRPLRWNSGSSVTFSKSRNPAVFPKRPFSVAQPILSRQIKVLESELGVELLYRNGRGIVLSEVGKLLESYAHSVVKLVGQARSEIDAMRLMPQGRVAIAMPPSIGWVLTGPLVLQCRKAFPNIAMHVVEGFSGHVAEWLSTGRVDIGIVYQAPRLPTLATEPLFSDELISARRSGRSGGAGRQHG